MSRAASRTPAAAPAREPAPQAVANPAPGRLPAARHLLQRVHRGAGNGVVQRLLAARDGRLRAPAGITREIERRRGGGRPLEPSVRDRMENKVGADLGSVRVHTDGAARGLTDSLEARAFTSGSDVFFSPGSYRPDSSDGRRLLAHELTHVAQQAAGRVPGSPGEIRPAGDALEREAESTAQRSTAPTSRPSGRRRKGGGIQRQAEGDVPDGGTPDCKLPGGDVPPGGIPAGRAPDGSIPAAGVPAAGVRSAAVTADIPPAAAPPAAVPGAAVPAAAVPGPIPTVAEGGATSGPAPEEQGGFWASVRNLGAGALQTLEEFADVSSVWAPRILEFLRNPVGALLSYGWLELPDRYKPRLINRLIRWSEEIVSRVGMILSPLLGLLWPVVRSFIFGFLERMGQVSDELKISLSNRFVRLVTNPSLTFVWGFIKGLGWGLWEIVRSPYDLICLIRHGVKWLARFFSRLTAEDLIDAYILLDTGLNAFWKGLADLVTDPPKMLEFIGTVWHSIVGAVGQMGRGLANALLDFFQKPDEELGFESGRFTANIAFDAILAAITAGAAALLRRASGVIAEVIRLIQSNRVLRTVVRVLTSIVAPVMKGLEKVATLFRGGAFGKWVARFGKWFGRLLDVAFGALVAADLWVKGAPDPAEPEEGEDPAAASFDAPMQFGEDGEYVFAAEGYDLDLVPEGSAGALTAPVQRAKAAVPTMAVAEKAFLKDTAFESFLKDRLSKKGLSAAIPKMDQVISGQFDRTHGLDLIGIRKKLGGKLELWIIEAKGGRWPYLKKGKGGLVQMSPGWLRKNIRKALANGAIKKELMLATGIRDEARLLKRLRASKKAVVSWEKAKFLRMSRLRKVKKEAGVIWHTIGELGKLRKL